MQLKSMKFTRVLSVYHTNICFFLHKRYKQFENIKMLENLKKHFFR